MAQKRIRLYIKGKLEFGTLNFDQQRMTRLGTVAVGTVKDRVQRGLNENDAKAKPLNRGYAIRKTKAGLRNIRDLTMTGDMMRNFSLRTVTNTEAYARNTTKRAQDKARWNNNKERWVVYSRTNVDGVMKAANTLFAETVQNLVKTVPNGYVS
jgi:hypothetical protein